MVASKQLWNSSEEGRGAETYDMDRLIQVFQKPLVDPVQSSAGPLQPHKPAEPVADLEAGLDLLDSVATAFDVLVSLCQQLEIQMTETAARTKAEAEVLNQLKKLASGMKTQTEEVDKRLDAMKMQSEAAEARAAAAEARVAALQADYDLAARQGAAAENLVTQFHDMITTAFRKHRQVQRTTATCGKCGLKAEIIDFPGNRRSATVLTDKMRECCTLAGSPTFKMECNYLQEAVLASTNSNAVTGSAVQNFDPTTPH